MRTEIGARTDGGAVRQRTGHRAPSPPTCAARSGAPAGGHPGTKLGAESSRFPIHCSFRVRPPHTHLATTVLNQGLLWNGTAKEMKSWAAVEQTRRCAPLQHTHSFPPPPQLAPGPWRQAPAVSQNLQAPCTGACPGGRAHSYHPPFPSPQGLIAPWWGPQPPGSLPWPFQMQRPGGRALVTFGPAQALEAGRRAKWGPENFLLEGLVMGPASSAPRRIEGLSY